MPFPTRPNQRRLACSDRSGAEDFHLHGTSNCSQHVVLKMNGESIQNGSTSTMIVHVRFIVA
ncbi:hypothetical protein [Tabrizicola sp. M-4]|uniref:hypothetical protein n=1 Tax=Tabrizicola sp. M-4 TaxID=3055847 RepID=UPI003DAA2397